MKSLRARLVVLLLVGLTAALVPAGLATYVRARDEVGALIDWQLREMALSLRMQSLQSVVAAGEAANVSEGDLVLQIWDRASGLGYVSRSDRNLPLQRAQGFHDVEWGGSKWRVFTLASGARLIQVALPAASRARIGADVALRNLVPVLLLVPAAGVIVWFGVGFGLRPLRRTAEALRKRQADALDPLPAGDLPEEVRPLADALNDLLWRLDRAFTAQRQFVGDAAHELRTPLTALQLQLQNLERASSEADRKASVADLRAGLERAKRLVEQLLALARIEPDAPAKRAAVDLEALARSVVSDLSPVAEAGDIDLGVARCSPAVVEADGDQLRLLLRNLADNAVRYTPAGGRVDVSVHMEGDEGILEVLDTGPGIPAGERERVFDRFHRGAEANGSGSGLGLAIVRRVVERHGGRISLDAGEGGKGLRVTVRLPAGGPPSQPHDEVREGDRRGRSR